MAVTPELLARLKSLDDLHEFVAALGYAPCSEELNALARERLGLGGALGTRRAAIVGRHGPFLIYGAVLDSATRSQVAQIAISKKNTLFDTADRENAAVTFAVESR